jgi:predicted ATP-grasp superfamily ATP-dependent carboligase
LPSPIEFRQTIQTQVRGGILVDCTKRAGLENEIVARYLIDQFKMKPVVVLDCDEFSFSVSHRRRRAPVPIQIYASMTCKLSVLKADVKIPSSHEKQLARGLIGWSVKEAVYGVDNIFRFSESG